MAYRSSKAELGVTAPAKTFRRNDMLPTDGGPRVVRSPLKHLVTEAKVKAAPDPVAGGYTVTGEADNAAAATAYGTSRLFEYSAPFVSDQVGADSLAAHVIDYNSSLPERLEWRSYFGTKVLSVDLGDLVAVVTPEETRNTLVVERLAVLLGRSVSGAIPQVTVTAVDRAP